MRIATVGIVGAGTMGAGIATNLAQHGITVILHDERPAAVDRAGEVAAAFYARAVEKGRLSEADAGDARRRIRPATRLEALAAADLVIEAVFEDATVKGRVLEELSTLLDPATLVATNTSCLRVSDLARNVDCPARFLGLHYFSPAATNPVVEVVSGRETTSETIDEAVALCRATAKRPLRCRDSYGFAINRFFCPYTNEAARALDDGLGSAAQIDAAAADAVGAAAGPFAVMNLIKPRINLHAIRNLAPLGPFYAPAASMTAAGDADRAWPIEPAPALAEPERQRIVDRLRLGVFLPVLQELDEGVAEPPAIDLGAAEALRFTLPPCALMDRLGRDEVARILEPALAAFGLPAPRSLDRVGQLMG